MKYNQYSCAPPPCPEACGCESLLPYFPIDPLGGLYLCFEGVEKLAHKFLHPAEEHAEKAAHKEAVSNPEIDLVATEQAKIKGAVRTDFILSAEIIVISLGTVAAASFGVQLGVLSAISVLMTVGVYGLVAGIVKLDDAGLYLADSSGSASRALGRGILAFAPWLMKTLSVVGTAAMFIVGGGIITHGFHWLSVQIASTAEAASALPAVGDILAGVTTILLDSAVGIAAGAAVLALVELWKRWRGTTATATH